MAEAATKLPVKTEKKPAEVTSAMPAWWPVEGLRREIDRLLDDFGMGFRRSHSAVRCSRPSHSGAGS